MVCFEPDEAAGQEKSSIGFWLCVVAWAVEIVFFFVSMRRIIVRLSCEFKDGGAKFCWQDREEW